VALASAAVGQTVVAVSAEHGTGLDALIGGIVVRLTAGNLDGGADEAAVPITREGTGLR